MPSSGLHRLGGGIAARERAVWEGSCALERCHTGATVAGVIETVSGPVGFCAPHCDRAEELGKTVRRERLTRIAGSMPIEGVRREGTEV